MRERWSAERINLLKTLWAGGASAGAIAARLGVSRSAVLGKVFRLGLAAPADSKKIVPQESAPQKTSRPTAPAKGKSLLELTNASCRWPFGRPGTANFFFCGVPEADLEGGMPYCPRHARRAYPTRIGVIEPAKQTMRPGGTLRPASAAPEQSRARRAASRRR